MFRGKGTTKAAAMTIPVLRRLQRDFPHIDILVNKNKRGTCYAYPDRSLIVINTNGRSNRVIASIALHEIGHIRCCHYMFAKDKIKREREAWNFARNYPKQHNYPFSEKEVKRSLATYQRSFEKSKKVYKASQKICNHRAAKEIAAKEYKAYYEEIWSCLTWKQRWEQMDYFNIDNQ